MAGQAFRPSDSEDPWMEWSQNEMWVRAPEAISLQVVWQPHDRTWRVHGRCRREGQVWEAAETLWRVTPTAEEAYELASSWLGAMLLA